MLYGSSSPGIAGSELTRLLSRLGSTPAALAAPAFAERLGQWLSWTGAIELSAALQTPMRHAARGPTGSTGREAADFERVRTALEANIAAGPDDRDDASPTDFAPYRRHCAALQQAMHDAIAALRQRLRDALVRRAPALAPLAAIDAVLDRTLAAQERHLLGLLPQRLQARFEQLRDEAAAGWIHRFHDEMACLLRAELAHRLQPAQGLLASLPPSASP